eukprot:scaffold15588_cov62-Isochrysis_galbana.AAC.1
MAGRVHLAWLPPGLPSLRSTVSGRRLGRELESGLHSHPAAPPKGWGPGREVQSRQSEARSRQSEARSRQSEARSRQSEARS